MLNRKQVQIDSLLEQRAALPLVLPAQPSQVIRILQMSEGKNRIDKIVNSHTIAKLKSSFDNRVFSDHNTVEQHLSENAKELIDLAMKNNNICMDKSWLTLGNEKLLATLTRLYPSGGTSNSTALEKF